MRTIRTTLLFITIVTLNACTPQPLPKGEDGVTVYGSMGVYYQSTRTSTQ